jgi:acetyl-CoA carboxylase alpha subunit
MPSGDAERARLNYGLVKADGYALSYNMMSYAEENGLMLHTYIDTIGGDPFEYSAGKLQSWLISNCQAKMISLRTKSISTVIGSGGSGGAIALQLAHKRYMLSAPNTRNNRRRLLGNPFRSAIRSRRPECCS